MKKLYIGLILLFSLIINLTSYAQNPTAEEFQITGDSIGFVKIGTPFNDIKKTSEKLGYTIKHNDLGYVIYDKKQTPIITFTVFERLIQTKPVRTIKTTSSKFTFDNDITLIGTNVEALAEKYPEVSIFRVNSNPNSPEIVDFKGWPFTESSVKSKFLLKYQAVLNKVTDEYGKTRHVGLYPTDFSVYTNKYLPEAKIESFQIEAIEPKIRFEDQNNK